jgi:hypothetical protein
MNYDDGETWTLLGSTDERLIAVGWLASPGPSSVPATADEALIERLVELLRDPWQPAVAVGRHRCAACVYSGGPSHFSYRGSAVAIGTNNLYVPAAELVYVCPSSIVHSMDSHGYTPPSEFRSAVLACPPMRSMEYLRRVREFGLHRLGR